MGNIGPLELVVVLAIALIVLGPNKLPDAARAVGRGVREFKESLSGIVGDDDEDRAGERDHVDAPAPPVPPAPPAPPQ